VNVPKRSSSYALFLLIYERTTGKLNYYYLELDIISLVIHKFNIDFSINKKQTNNKTVNYCFKRNYLTYNKLKQKRFL